jgi:hypothetical protein
MLGAFWLQNHPEISIVIINQLNQLTKEFSCESSRSSPSLSNAIRICLQK